MEYEDDIKNRVKRIEGQARGLLNMMEQEKDCREVVTQMTAVRNALDRTVALLVSQNLEQCIREGSDNGEDSEQLVQEAVNLLVKSR